MTVAALRGERHFADPRKRRVRGRVRRSLHRVIEVISKLHGIPSAGLTLLRRPLPARGRGAAVLCYHDVGTDPANTTEYYVSPALLTRQIEWMRGWGYTFVPVAEIVDRLLGGRDLDGLAAMTFDDALIGVGEHAAPLLASRGVPATVFVVTEVLGVDPPFWPGAARTMTEPELLELSASMLITLASHTATHASLPDISPDDRIAECERSRAWLRDRGAVDDLLAYPFGHHDPAAHAAAAGAGYRAAFTFTFGRVIPSTSPMAIPRFCIGPGHDRFRLARQLARPARSW